MLIVLSTSQVPFVFMPLPAGSVWHQRYLDGIELWNWQCICPWKLHLFHKIKAIILNWFECHHLFLVLTFSSCIVLTLFSCCWDWCFRMNVTIMIDTNTTDVVFLLTMVVSRRNWALSSMSKILFLMQFCVFQTNASLKFCVVDVASTSFLSHGSTMLVTPSNVLATFGVAQQ